MWEAGSFLQNNDLCVVTPSLDTSFSAETESVSCENRCDDHLVDVAYAATPNVVVAAWESRLAVFPGKSPGLDINYALTKEHPCSSSSKPLCQWDALTDVDEKQREFFERVGKFTSLSVDPWGHLVLLGTTAGYLLIFKLELSEEIDGTRGVPFAEVKPFVWNHIAHTIEDATTEVAGRAVMTLAVCALTETSILAAVLLASSYLAVLDIDPDSGAMLLDMLQIPPAMSCVTVESVSAPYLRLGWKAHIAVAGLDGLLVFEVSTDRVTLSQSIDLQPYHPTASDPRYKPDSSNSCLLGLHFQTASETLGLSSVMIAWRRFGMAGHDTLEVITVNLSSEICRVDSTGVDGTILGLTFTAGHEPLALQTINPYLSPSHALEGVCIVTTRSFELLTLPDLQLLYRGALPFSVSDPSACAETVTGGSQSTRRTALEDGGRPTMRLCSLLSCLAPVKPVELADDLGRESSITTVVPLVLVSTQASDCELAWLLKRDVIPMVTKPAVTTSIPAISSATALHESMSHIKSEIELAIQKSRDGGTLDPSHLLRLFHVLITRAESGDQYRNIPSYIANLARHATFPTLPMTRCLLVGTAELLQGLKETSPEAVRSVLSMQRSLQRLGTYELLTRMHHRVELEAWSTAADIDKLQQIAEDTLLEFDPAAWGRFAKADVVRLCCGAAAAGDLHELIVVFNRHVTEIDKDRDIRAEKVMRILSCLPVHLKSAASEALLGDWIRYQVVPFLTNVSPFLDWVYGRAVALEALWEEPHPALTFLRSLFPRTPEKYQLCPKDSLKEGPALQFTGGAEPLLESLPLLPGEWVSECHFWGGSGTLLGDFSGTLLPKCPNESTTAATRPASRRKEGFQRLMRLYCILAECAEIRSKHGVNLRVADLDGGRVSWTDVAYELLNRVRLHELLSDEVRLHVHPFCCAHGLNTESLLLTYIYDVVAEIDADLGEVTETEAGKLIHCLRKDESKAKAFMWLLQTQSDANAQSLASSVEAILESKTLAGSPLLDDLRTAMVYRQLKCLLDKYSIRVGPSIMAKPSDLKELIKHLACLLSWGDASLHDAISIVRLLQSTHRADVDAVFVVMERLQALSSAVNHKLLTQIATGIREARAASDDPGGRPQTTEATEQWERVLRPGLLRSIKETVLVHLTFQELTTVTEMFTHYAFTLLDDASRVLQPEDNTKQSAPLLYRDLTAAEAIVTASIALFLIQHVSTVAARTCRLPQMLRYLEALQRWNRLHRDFGVFVCPRDLAQTMLPDTAVMKVSGRSCLYQRWQNVVIDEAIGKAREKFTRLGIDRIHAAVDSFRCLDAPPPAGGGGGRLSSVSVMSAPPIGTVPQAGMASSRFTRLLQFGVLMGVGESFARQSVVRPLGPSKRSNVRDATVVRRLLADLRRNPTPKNAADIMQMLGDIILQLAETDSSRVALSILTCMSQIFEVAVGCLQCLDSQQLQQGIQFTMDVLLSLQLLVQSDLIDTAVDIHDVSSHGTTLIPGVTEFAAWFLPSLWGREHKSNDSWLASSGLFSGRFRGFSALYERQDALAAALNILALRVRFWRENTPSVQAELEAATMRVIDKLLDLEGYELAIAFIMKPVKTFHGSKLREAASHLLAKVTVCRGTFDFDLGVGLSLLLGKTDVWRRFVEAIPSIREVSSVLFYSRLMIDVGILFQVPPLVKNSFQIWVRAKWRETLDSLRCQYDSTRFQEVREGSSHNACQRDLLPHLLITSKLDLPLAVSFSRDFGLSEEDTTSLWLRLVIVGDTHGEPQDYKQLTLPVLYALPPCRMRQILEDECLPLISPYDYERIEFVLCWIPDRPVSKSGRILLRCLRTYKSAGSDGGNHQHSAWWILGVIVLHLLSNLPPMNNSSIMTRRQKLLHDPWVVLGPEVADATLNTFLPLYPLRLRKDDFALQLLWNFVADVMERGPLALKPPKWILETRTKQRDVSHHVTVKTISMLKNCFTVRPDRALSAAVLILNLPVAVELSNVQGTIASWVVEHLDSVIEGSGTKDAVIRLAAGVPPYIPDLLHDYMSLTHPPKGLTRPWIPYNLGEGQGWAVKISKHEALQFAGVMQSRLALKLCGLEQFGSLLPEYSLLCVHALYFYLAPILLRPNPFMLSNAHQVEIFLKLTHYPWPHIPSATPVFDKELETLGIQDVKLGLTHSIHSLVDVICMSCDFSPKTVRQSIISRLMKSPYWSPLYCLALLEKNSAMYKEPDIVAMVGSVPQTSNALVEARHLIEEIEASELTEGFRDEWFSPLRAAPMRTDKQTAIREGTGSTGVLAFGQSLIELISTQRLFFIASGLETKTTMKLVLDAALKNERALCKSSRALAFGYTCEHSEVIHSYYKESPRKTLEFWNHCIYLDTFAYLGIASQFGNFVKADKAGLVRAFWRQSSRLPSDNDHYVMLLVVIAALILDFQVQDPKLLARVLRKLFAIVQDPPPSTSTKPAAILPPQVFLRSLLRSLFFWKGPDILHDADLLGVLHDIFLAPVTSLLTTIQKLSMTEMTPPVSREEYHVQLSGQLEWFFLVPRYLHRSPFPHQQHTITRRYFEVCHYIAHLESLLATQEDDTNENKGPRPPPPYDAGDQQHLPFSGPDHRRKGMPLPGVIGATTWLTALDSVWRHKPDIQWLLEASGIARWFSSNDATVAGTVSISTFEKLGVVKRSTTQDQQPMKSIEGIIRRHTRALVGMRSTDSQASSESFVSMYPTQHQQHPDLYKMSFKDHDTATTTTTLPDMMRSSPAALARLQLITAAVGLQCLESSTEPAVAWTTLYESLRHELRGCCAPLLLMLTEAAAPWSITTQTLRHVVAEVVARRHEAEQQLQRLLRHVPILASTPALDSVMATARQAGTVVCPPASESSARQQRSAMTEL